MRKTFLHCQTDVINPQGPLYSKLTVCLYGLGLIGLWLLSRPYMGIAHDARIYVGRVLASGAPSTLGRDMMFAKDGQLDFTIFPKILASSIDLFGVSQGVLLVSLVSLLSWLAALWLLVNQLSKGSDRWIIVIFVAVLPHWYGNLMILSFAESFATGRCGSEAAVITGIAFYLKNRSLALPLLFVIISVLLHPIMALPGAALLACLVFWHAPTKWKIRLAALAVATAVLTILLAMAHTPIFERLFTRVDHNWMDMLQRRAFLIFTTQWMASDWARIFVHSCTCLLATQLSGTRHKPFYLFVIGLALFLTSLSWLLGDILHSVLILEVQLWRATWILAVLASISLARCCIKLSAMGNGSRATLALLGIAWLATLAPESPALAILASMASVVFYNVITRQNLSPRTVRLLDFSAIFLASIYAAFVFSSRAFVIAQLISSAPKYDAHNLYHLFSADIFSIVLFAMIFYNVSNTRIFLRNNIKISISLLLLFCSVFFWDQRISYRKFIDAGKPDPKLEQLLQSRPGEVFWLDGEYDAWVLSNRPQWFTILQGASAVFSRPLGREWGERVDTLISDKVVDADLKRTLGTSVFRTPLTLTTKQTFCAHARHAPAWIIAPLDLIDSQTLPPETYQEWKAPISYEKYIPEDMTFTWTTRQVYAVLPCAPEQGPVTKNISEETIAAKRAH